MCVCMCVCVCVCVCVWCIIDFPIYFQFYRKLNTVVRIALVEIETWTTTNQISVTTDARATLNLWKVYYQANINTKPSRPDAGLLFV